MYRCQHNSRLLLHPVFLLSLLLLIINDQYWKYAYGNILTGKLSDLAGLVLLPLVLCFLLPRLGQASVWWSGFFFLFWKTPWISPIIEYYNEIALIPISRTIDYTDYWALLILPLPYYLIQKFNNTHSISATLSWRRVSSWLILLLTSFSFIATQPPYWYSFQQSNGNVTFHNSRYDTKMSRAKVLAALADRGIIALQDTALAGQAHMRNWVISDSMLAYDPPFYRIPHLSIGNDTLHEVQFSLMPKLNGKDEVIILLNGLQVDDLTTNGVDRKLRRMYRKVLKKELVQRSLR